MDQQRPLPTINCSHPKQAKKAPYNEALDSSYVFFKCCVHVCLPKYGRDFLSEMSAFQLKIC